MNTDVNKKYHRDGVNFEEHTSLPEERNMHCLAVIDENTLFVSGGSPGYIQAAYIYRRSTG